MALPNVWGANPWGVGGAGAMPSANWWIPPGSTESAILEDDPSAGYQRFLGGVGRGGGQSNIDQWYGQQRQRVYNSYLAALPEHTQAQQPYRFLDYLRDYGGNLQGEYAGLSANQRGERNPYHRLRWIL